MSMTEESVRHAMGSAVPGGVQFGGPQQARAPVPPAAPFGGQQGAPSPPQQSTTPARSEDRRGVADTPSAPVRHSAMPANASGAPNRDDELKSSIDGWEGPKNLDYWKLKAEAADRAAKRARGIDPNPQQAAQAAPAAARAPTGEGHDRPGDSSSGGASRGGIGDDGGSSSQSDTQSEAAESFSDGGGHGLP